MSESFAELLDQYDNPKRVFSCTTKRRFKTEPEVKMAAYHFELKNKREYDYYKCRFCARWHLTTKK